MMTTENKVAAKTGSSPFIEDDELRRRIPMSRKTAFEWRRKRILPYVQTGRKILYHWPSVEAALLRLQK